MQRSHPHLRKRLDFLVLLGCLTTAGSALAQTNTWIVLSPVPTTRWMPSSYWDCTTTDVTANPFGRNYCGSVYGNGKIYYWGGAHFTYPGNDMDVYDIATNRWIPDPTNPQCYAPCVLDPATPGYPCDNWPPGTSCVSEPYNPDCLTGSGSLANGTCSKTAFRCSGGSRDNETCSTDTDCPNSTCLLLKPTPGTVCINCRPYTDHTYQKGAFNPVRGRPFWVLTSGTWEWDYATRRWTWLGTPPPPSAGIANRLVIWDGSGSRMLYLQFGGGNRGVYSFSYATNTWTKLDGYMPTGSTWCEAYGTWDGASSRAVIMVGCGGSASSWYLYNPTLAGTDAWTDVTAGAPDDVKVQRCGSTYPCVTESLTYDATNRQTIVLTHEWAGQRVFALWAYDAVGNTWFKVTTSGGTGGIDKSGRWNQLHYDPGTASLYLLDQVGQWQHDVRGTARTLKITLDLGSPLPTSTPAGTSTATPPINTPTRTPSPRPTNTGLARTATPTSAAPGPTCAGTVHWVGPGRAYAKPSQAAAVVQANDCVYIDAGTYPNDVALWPARASNLTIRGINGVAKLTVTNGLVYGDKAIWVVAGANTTIENVDFSCASSRTNNPHCSGILVGDENDAGIRLEAPGLIVRNCVFRDNDNGILGGPTGGSPNAEVLIEHSEFFRNGLGDGLTHNLYLNRNNTALTFRYNYSHGAITGHNLKSRAATNHILYNRIMDEQASTNDCTNPGTCSASAEVELPCGGLAYVIGNILHKASTADARGVVKFAAELGSSSCPQPPLATQELYVVNNTMVSDYGSSTYYIRGHGTAPLLWAKNNIFWGGGTSINWPAGGTVVQANNVTADPELLSQATYDYRLTAASAAAINQGTYPGSDARGYNLMPMQQYLYDRAYAPRPSDGLLDVGAFEYISKITPFPTPTATPTNSRRPSPVPTPTPATPVHCAAGQLEAVYPVAASEDDGEVRRRGTDYNSLGSPFQSTGGARRYEDYVIRRNSGGTYQVQLVNWRWNTTARPDGSAWPPGTQVVGAYARPYWLGAGSGTRSLVFEWHDWPSPTPLSDADWTRDPVGVSAPTFAAATGRPGGRGRQTVALSNAAANVNLAGYTGMRLTVSDGAPPAVNEDNTVALRPQDYQTSAGDQSTELVVCYLVGPTSTPRRPSAPQLF